MQGGTGRGEMQGGAKALTNVATKPQAAKRKRHIAVVENAHQTSSGDNREDRLVEWARGVLQIDTSAHCEHNRKRSKCKDCRASRAAEKAKETREPPVKRR